MRIATTTNGDLPICADLVEALITAAQNAHSREVCGLLLGEEGRIIEVRETGNVHPTPESHFEIDPQALIDAYRDERGGGLQLIGYFHSHPSGPPVPSETDKATRAGDGKLWAIVAGGNLRFWQDAPEGFHALSYEVIGR